MIAITHSSGNLVRVIPNADQPFTYGFHKLFGFASERGAERRAQNRKMHGLKSHANDWLCQFKVKASKAGWSLESLSGCNVRQDGDQWVLTTALGEYRFTQETEVEALPYMSEALPAEDQNQLYKITGILTFLSLMIPMWMLLRPAIEEKKEEIKEPVKVTIVKPRNMVSIPIPKALTGVKKVAKDATKEQKMRRAIRNNLGFLGLVGRKNLTKALGGAPSKLKDASPGAGAGGKEGSGGEYLTGLGKGLRKTTVGNTGVAGLGGIGTKGRGGGQGGYGNSLVASGEGGKISDIPLSNDIVLEGGLSKSVIQATIAKYLSQVRACYENGLRKNPALTGIVGTAFSINAGGGVMSPRVTKSTLGHRGVEGCIQNRMKTWKFPKPVGGVSVKVSYPFLLRPVSS